MKRKLILTSVFTALTVSAYAGGYFTNTNQSVSFLRQPAQTAVIGVNGAYFNPAGVGFLDNGFHLSFDIQTVTQRRYNTTTYAPLAYGVDNNGSQSKKYTGKTFAPVLPHFDLAYNHDNWFASFHFGVVTGGGKAKYYDGLSSFETPIAMLVPMINTLGKGLGFTSDIVSAYDVDTELVGEQYNFSGQLNLGYRINEHWSVSAGVRLNYIYNNYDGSLSNVQLMYGDNMLPAATVLGNIISAASGGSVDAATGAAMAGSLVGDKEIKAHQKDIAFTPILSVDYRVGDFNFAAKYEFNTKVRLKNDTEVNTTGISTYDDGAVRASDIPAILSLGGLYNIRRNLRVSLGWNYYFDKQSRQYNSATGLNDKQDLLKRNTYEILGGVEWDINDMFTVSCGAHNTSFGFGKDKEYVSDMSFSTNSVSVGLGGRINVSRKVAFDLAFYKTFYSHMTKTQADYNGIGNTYFTALSQYTAKIPALGSLSKEALQVSGSDEFYRKSFVVGLGIVVDF